MKLVKWILLNSTPTTLNTSTNQSAPATSHAIPSSKASSPQSNVTISTAQSKYTLHSHLFVLIATAYAQNRATKLPTEQVKSYWSPTSKILKLNRRIRCISHLCRFVCCVGMLREISLVGGLVEDHRLRMLDLDMHRVDRLGGRPIRVMVGVLAFAKLILI